MKRSRLLMIVAVLIGLSLLLFLIWPKRPAREQGVLCQIEIKAVEGVFFRDEVYTQIIFPPQTPLDTWNAKIISSSSSKSAKIEWRYTGKPLPIQITSAGSSSKYIVLTPDSPPQLTVSLRRQGP